MEYTILQIDKWYSRLVNYNLMTINEIACQDPSE